MAARAAAGEQTVSDLLNLPPELLSIILTYVVAEGEPIDVHRERIGLRKLRPMPSFLGSTHPTWRCEYLVHPKLPAIGSVCKPLRNEALPIYYSANQFIIETQPRRIVPAVYDRGAEDNAFALVDPYWTIEEWRLHLGRHVRHLRDVTVVTSNLHVLSKGSFGLAHRDECYERIATRAMFRQDGMVLFGHVALGNYFCVCDLRPTLGVDKVEKKDGERLLEALDSWVDSGDRLLYNDYATVCGICSLPQLEHFSEYLACGGGGVGNVYAIGGGAWT